MVTRSDGYQMARKGRAGPDLGIAAFVSSIGLAFVLGPLLENNLRKSLIMSQGDFIFLLSPGSYPRRL